MSTPALPLSQVAEINPRFKTDTTSDELISFVPMASVSEVTGRIEIEDERPLKDVVKGFTPFQSDDVIVAKITPCFENGKIAHAQVSHRYAFGSTEFHVVRADHTKLDSRYLFHFLRQPRIRLEGEKKMTGSAGQRRVPKHFLESLLIPVPSLAEQRRIAAILDKADALRQKRRQAIAKLDELLQSVFLDMFGDPVTNPMKWPVVPFAKLGTTRLGKMLDEKKQGHLPKRLYIRNANVQWDRFDLTSLFEMGISENEQERFKILCGDLLICEGGEPGRAAIWRGQIEDCYYQKALHRLRVDADVTTPEYVLFLLWRLALSGRLSDRVTSATIAHLTGEKISAIPVPLPPLDSQQRFSNLYNSTKMAYRNQEHHKNEIEVLWTSLQRRAFAGEL